MKRMNPPIMAKYAFYKVVFTDEQAKDQGVVVFYAKSMSAVEAAVKDVPGHWHIDTISICPPDEVDLASLRILP